MTYKTLMAQISVGKSNGELLRITSDLAARHDARIVGIAACQPMPLAYGDGYPSGAAIVDCQNQLKAELRNAEAEFREALKDSKAKLEWRSDYTTEALPYYLASEARCADLIIASVGGASAFDTSRHTSLGDLVIRAGRPILVVPDTGASTPFNRIVVAWKDTREARRAAVAALPMLALASHVTVLEVADEPDMPAARGRGEDVANWLAEHGIAAVSSAVASSGDNFDQIGALLNEHAAELVVAGAYGHSRLREWAFGGVTRGLLKGGRCALLAH